MESNKQEKSNLLNNNPIAAQAGGSWISKHMGGGMSPLQSKGSMAYKQGEKDKDDESISAKDGKKGSNISNEDRRDESLGDYGTRTK